MEYELYLMHWGIKGQRWGIRKYQNADGTLTAAGKARYASGGDNPRHKPSEARKKAKYEASRADLLEKGSATDLLKNRKKYNFTDAELKKASERIATKIEVDRKLKELSEKELAKGKSWVDKAVDTATTWKDRVEKGINVWNVVAKIHNSFVDEDDAWQKIGEKSVKEAARERTEKKRKEAEEKAMSKLAADAAVYKDLNYDDLKKYASAYDKKELKKAIDFLDSKNKNDNVKKSNSESEETAKQKMIAEAVLNKRINGSYDELKKYTSLYSKDELEKHINKLEAQKRSADKKAAQEKKAQEAADNEKKRKADEEKERQAREAKEKAAKAAKAEEKRKAKEEKITKLTSLMKQARATSSNVDDERVRKFFEQSGLSWEDYELASNEAGKKRR